MDVIMIHRRDLDDAIRDAAQRGAELAIRRMPKDRPTQYNLKAAANELGLHPNLDSYEPHPRNDAGHLTSRLRVECRRVGYPSTVRRQRTGCSSATLTVVQ